jgi:hypothetical protein
MHLATLWLTFSQNSYGHPGRGWPWKSDFFVGKNVGLVISATYLLLVVSTDFILKESARVNPTYNLKLQRQCCKN